MSLKVEKTSKQKITVTVDSSSVTPTIDIDSIKDRSGKEMTKLGKELSELGKRKVKEEKQEAAASKPKRRANVKKEGTIKVWGPDGDNQMIELNVEKTIIYAELKDMSFP